MGNMMTIICTLLATMFFIDAKIFLLMSTMFLIIGLFKRREMKKQ
jgi:hypothetical protein